MIKVTNIKLYTPFKINKQCSTSKRGSLNIVICIVLRLQAIQKYVLWKCLEGLSHKVRITLMLQYIQVSWHNTTRQGASLKGNLPETLFKPLYLNTYGAHFSHVSRQAEEKSHEGCSCSLNLDLADFATECVNVVFRTGKWMQSLG